MALDVKGTFITFEGSEGSGKSTQIELLRQYLSQKGKDVLFIREPGGVKISEKIRSILLDVENEGMGDECETLLYMAARGQLVREVIIPALQRGQIILCDRYIDSTVAYQGYGNGVSIEDIRLIGKFATKNIMPDMTFVFDIDATYGLARIKREKDRIELRNSDYHNRVRQGYLNIAKQEPKRVKVLDASKSKEDLQQMVRHEINQLLGLL